MKPSAFLQRSVVFLATLLLPCSWGRSSVMAESVSQSIHPSATTGPFFRVQLMFHPLFRDGFEASADLPSIKTRVFERMDVSKNEKLKAILESASKMTTEKQADQIVSKLKKALKEAAEELEAELRNGFDPKVYRELQRNQLGMLGLRGLADPRLADLLHLDPKQQESIQGIVLKNPLRSFRSQAVIKNEARRRAMEDELAKRLLGRRSSENAPVKTSVSTKNPNSNAVTSKAAAGQKLLTPIEAHHQKLLEYDQSLQAEILPLLSPEQKLIYDQCVEEVKQHGKKLNARSFSDAPR